jgi:hypothetical protein
MAAFKLRGQRMPEDVSQQALVSWCRLMKLPVIHIPNEGKRSVATAVWLRSMGMVAGCADLFLARPCVLYGGFWIELKSHGKRPTASQIAFLDNMREEGYLAEWFDDWEDAKYAIEQYLRLPRN